MVAGQNQPQTLNYDKCQKMAYIYIMYFIALLPFSKKSRNFASIQKTLVTNYIGSIIG